jgi:hypothetical protein
VRVAAALRPEKNALLRPRGTIKSPISLEVLHRARVSVIEPRPWPANAPGHPTAQPYHYVEEWKIPEAKKYLAECATTGRKLAAASLREMMLELEGRGYRVTRFAILTGSEKALPPLEKILAAHPLIHTAEGIFFRQIFRDAAEKLGLRVTEVREKEIGAQAKIALGKNAARVQGKIARMGKIVGPPWTTDQKLAALAACIALGH